MKFDVELESNTTLQVVLQDLSSFDIFEGVWSNQALNWSMIGAYGVGLAGCYGLRLVSWYERSGEAGPFRTLVNRLVSFNLDQVVIHYVVGNGIDVLRAILGPLPQTVCKLGALVKGVVPLNLSLLTLTNTALRFAFVCIYKSIPVMEDDFLSVNIYACVNLWSVLATLGKIYVAPKPLLIESICTGTWEPVEPEEDEIPLSTFVTLGCVAGHGVLSIPIKMAKNSHPSPGGSNSLGEMALSWTLAALLLMGGLVFLFIKKMDIEDLSVGPHNLLIYCYHILIPVLVVVCLNVLFFSTNKNLCRSAKKLMFPNQHVQQVNP